MYPKHFPEKCGREQLSQVTKRKFFICGQKYFFRDISWTEEILVQLRQISGSLSKDVNLRSVFTSFSFLFCKILTKSGIFLKSSRSPNAGVRNFWWPVFKKLMCFLLWDIVENLQCAVSSFCRNPDVIQEGRSHFRGFITADNLRLFFPYLKRIKHDKIIDFLLANIK